MSPQKRTLWFGREEFREKMKENRASKSSGAKEKLRDRWSEDHKGFTASQRRKRWTPVSLSLLQKTHQFGWRREFGILRWITSIVFTPFCIRHHMKNLIFIGMLDFQIFSKSFAWGSLGVWSYWREMIFLAEAMEKELLFSGI